MSEEYEEDSVRIEIFSDPKTGIDHVVKIREVERPEYIPIVGAEHKAVKRWLYESYEGRDLDTGIGKWIEIVFPNGDVASRARNLLRTIGRRSGYSINLRFFDREGDRVKGADLDTLPDEVTIRFCATFIPIVDEGEK